MPTHEFILVNNTPPDYKVIYSELIKTTPLENKLILDDDLFDYFSDIFSWVIGKTLDNNTISLGENKWGVTILDINCQPVFSEIINGLIKIFSVAPENILIYGNYTMKLNINGENEDEKFLISQNEIWNSLDGEYDKIHITKNDILNTLSTLKKFIDKLNEESFYLIHFGI